MQHQKLTFKKSMLWEPEITTFVESRMKGYTLNCPCGESTLGDVRVDIEKKENVTETCDLFKLPYPNETFDTVISDPPWIGINYYLRPRWFFKVVDLCKVGGTLIYNATWIPSSKYTQLEETWVRQSASFANISALTVFTKTKKSPPFDYSNGFVISK